MQIQKDGRALEVTEKAYRVVYAPLGYVPAVSEGGSVEQEQDLFHLTSSELKKLTKDQITSFLDKEEIEYSSKDTKDTLIALIAGEEDEDEQGGSEEETSNNDG